MPNLLKVKRAVSARQFPAGGDKPGCARRAGNAWVHARPRRGRRDGERAQLVLIATVNEIYLGPRCRPCILGGPLVASCSRCQQRGRGRVPPFPPSQLFLLLLPPQKHRVPPCWLCSRLEKHLPAVKPPIFLLLCSRSSSWRGHNTKNHPRVTQGSPSTPAMCPQPLSLRAALPKTPLADILSFCQKQNVLSRCAFCFNSTFPIRSGWQLLFQTEQVKPDLQKSRFLLFIFIFYHPDEVIH